MIPKYKPIEKRPWQDIFFLAVFGCLILLVIGFLAVSNFKIYQKRAALDSRIEQLKGEIEEAQAKKQQLEAQLNQISREEYLETEARERFNLKKPGEEVVTVLPVEGEEKPQQEEKIKQWWNPLSW